LIRDDDIHFVLRKKFQTFCTTVRRKNSVSVGSQKSAERGNNAGFVIDNQNGSLPIIES